MSNLYNERNFQAVVSELQLLNPKAIIENNSNNDGIISNRPVNKLYLPQDFYVTRGGGLSNRGNTESGDYLLIAVDVINAELSQKPKLKKLNILGSLKQKLLTPKTQSTASNEFGREM